MASVAVATPSAAPVPPASPTPVPSPTPKPAVLTCTTTVKDPVLLGEKAKVTVKCPVGPTCTLVVHYPNGSVPTLPSPTHPSPGWWQWTWAIPTKGPGEAQGVTQCTEDGVQRAMDADFTMKAPSASWDIQVSLPATHPYNALGLAMTITITGTLQENPSYSQQRVVCSFELNTPGNSWSDGSEWVWDNGDPPMNFELQRPMTTADIGHATWTMKCRNFYIEPTHFEYDSGTIEIT
jgi:hypothetical protein